MSNFFSCRNFLWKLFKKPIIQNVMNKNHYVPSKLMLNYSAGLLHDKTTAVFMLGGLLSLFKKDEEKDSELIITMKRGILSAQKAEYKKAEQLFHVALKLAQEQMNYDAVTYCYDLLANLAFETNQYEKAERLFREVLQRIIFKGAKENDIKVLHISLKFAKIYQEKGDFEKAEQGYQYCLSNLQEIKEDEMNVDESLFYVLVSHWYSKFLLVQNKIQDAIIHLRNAYSMSCKTNGELHEQSILILNDLAIAVNLAGDVDSSMKYLHQAIDLGRKLPEQMEDLSAFYVNLGRLYFTKEIYEESEKYCLEGKRLAQKTNDHVTLTEAKHCVNEVHKVIHKKK